VRAGLALAYRRYSNDYVAEENAARDAKRGLWSGEFTPPWDWRHESREAAPEPPRPRATANDSAGTQAPNARCLIKGNINRRGERIYHLPGSDAYASTVIDERSGERWFCSEAEARAAGWRAARTHAAR
jgi:hypothetical protein